jgi:excisionase family DNA binding protein
VGALLRVKEFAEAGNFRESTIRAWVLRRKITVVRLGGRAIRIPASELDRLIQEGTVPARGSQRARN